jgi:methylated-DNA-[protein]-cysteine S-methyltransferase
MNTVSPIYYDQFDSPVGRLTVGTDGQAITALHIEGDRYFTAIPAGWLHDSAPPLLQQAAQELREYFAGRRRSFDLPLHLSGTPFQKAVWQALQGIPAGSTTTYSEIAAGIGRPLAVRAVGTAIGRNPACILIPCHRVLASHGGFGGYVAGIACKERLLRLESTMRAI